MENVRLITKDLPGQSIFQQVDHCMTSQAHKHHISVTQNQIQTHITTFGFYLTELLSGVGPGKASLQK